MIKIAICDDDARMRRELQRMCSDIAERSGEKAVFMQFQQGQEVLTYPDMLDILVLDIEMPGMSGIEVRKKLETVQNRSLIVYVTSHVECMREAFGKYVFGFVDKNCLKKQLSRILADAIQNIRSQAVYVDDTVDSRKILYIRSEHVYNHLVLHDGTEMLVRIGMQELETKLKPVDFVRSHRCYLVNLQWVDGIRDNKVCIMDHRIPLSRYQAKEVKDALKKYCWKNGRYC